MMFLRKTACAAGLVLLTLFTVLAHAAADARANKTLHLFLSTSETGLDPAVASDLASLNLMENIFKYNNISRTLLEGLQQF